MQFQKSDHLHRKGCCNVQTTTTSSLDCEDKFHIVRPKTQIHEERFGISKRSKIHGNKKKSVKSN